MNDNSAYRQKVKKRVEKFDELLIETIIERGPITRKGLVIALERPRSTIFDHLKKLLLKEKIRSYTKPKKKRGRPSVFYKVIQ